MPPPMISVAWLDGQGACPEQADLALLHFGSRPRRLTRNLLREAAELGLDVNWLAERILPAPLWAEYQRQRAPLWAEYERQRDTLVAEYERQRDTLVAEYERQRDTLLAEYQRQHAPLVADLLGLPEGT